MRGSAPRAKIELLSRRKNVRSTTFSKKIPPPDHLRSRRNGGHGSQGREGRGRAGGKEWGWEDCEGSEEWEECNRVQKLGGLGKLHGKTGKTGRPGREQVRYGFIILLPCDFTEKLQIDR